MKPSESNQFYKTKSKQAEEVYPVSICKSVFNWYIKKQKNSETGQKNGNYTKAILLGNEKVNK